jgi:SAM-dependent methyltransferase
MRSEMYALHEAHERSHWWYAARRRIVLHLLRRELRRSTGPLRLLDIGCGAGGMLAHLREFGDVTAVDPSPEAVAFAASKGTSEVYLGGLPHGLPFGDAERFDVITLLDVLEHVDDDKASLVTLHRLLAPGGLLVLTVPAFPFMWSSHDVVNEHKRRYTRRTLHDRLVHARFRIGTLSYYNTILFPPIAAVRVAARMLGGGTAEPDVGAVPGPVNAVLRSVFGAERFALGRVTLPFGVSLIATARPLDEHGGR